MCAWGSIGLEKELVRPGKLWRVFQAEHSKAAFVLVELMMFFLELWHDFPDSHHCFPVLNRILIILEQLYFNEL